METPEIFQQWEGEDSHFHMINVAQKVPTQRRAVAEGRINMSSKTLHQIQNLQMPKGDVLAMAEVAGVMAAKKTSEILPLCHPLPLESVRVRCKICESEPHGDQKKGSVLVSCEVITTAKTGVEMEALTAVSAALLSIYDLTKGVDPVLSISGIHLKTKEGGKSGKWTHPQFQKSSPSPDSQVHTQGCEKSLKGFSAAVITISDRCFAGAAKDQSGSVLSHFLLGEGAHVVQEILLPDEPEAIQAAVMRLSHEEKVDLILTTGGTGIGPRDKTFEALAGIWNVEIPGIGEFLRQEGFRATPMSWLSRSHAGLVSRSLVILLPGSPNAVREGVNSLKTLLPHALEVIQGKNHEHLKK